MPASNCTAPPCLMRFLTRERPDRQYLLAVLVAASGFILLVGAVRHYLAYGTETDFIGIFVHEAQRFLRGEPLQSVFHPPLYSIVIGLAHLITGDWLRAGLLVSWISGIVVLLSSFLLFRELCSRAAGFGALLGLLGSGLFLLNWGLATSDVFFLAGFMVSCLLAVRAYRSGSIRLWIACGVVVGLCLVTRTNAISLVVLLITPLFGAGSARAKVKSVLALLGGIVLPVAVLAVYAKATGSNLLPGNTYINLATTYFTEGVRTNSDEARQEVAKRFTGVRDVLLHNPAAIAKMYASDLYQLLASGITKLIEMPLYYAILPGLVFLIGAYFSPALLVLAVVAISQVLLVNLKSFEARYYLFLVPWLGAAIGEVFRRVADAPWPRPAQRAVMGFLSLMLLLAIGQAGAKTVYLLLHGEKELSEVVPRARREIKPRAVVLAIKPHVAFYSDASWEPLPALNSLAELKDSAQARDPKQPLYIFYGSIEQERRPQYAELAREVPPSWLQVAARSRKPGGWVLLRMK
jgi:hypothetical protein